MNAKKINKQNLPKVSIFMPTFNHENFISEAVESILSQDYTNTEIICSDDCSIDNTAEILKKYQSQNPKKLKLSLNNYNLGITANFNKILLNCDGKYIVFFSGDDIMLPKKISKLVEFMENNPDYVMCYHDLEVFDSESRKKICNYSELSRPPSGFESMLKPGTFVVGPNIILKSDAIPQSGFNLSLSSLTDWFFMVEVASKGKVGYLPEILTRYRRHKNNVSNSKNYYAEYFVIMGLLRSKFLSHSKQIRYYESHLYKSFMVNNFRNKNFDLAYICVREAFIGYYQPLIFLPLYIISLLRIGVLKILLDKMVGKIFTIIDKRYHEKKIDYKIYQKN